MVLFTMQLTAVQKDSELLHESHWKNLEELCRWVFWRLLAILTDCWSWPWGSIMQSRERDEKIRIFHSPTL
jgi:hypothetical protein